MGLFERKIFIILPNSRSYTLRFISQLIEDNGGLQADDTESIKQQLIILINDTFVDSSQKIADTELFRRELELDATKLWKIIVQKKPLCVRASCISEWLKLGEISLTADRLIDLQEVDLLGDSQVSVEGVNSINEVPSEEVQYKSQSETAAGTHASADKHMDTGENLPSEKLSSPSEVPTERLTRLIDEDKTSKNELLIKALGRLAKRYDIKGDRYRSRGYKLAKIGVERYPFEILSGEQARREIASVGSSIARKIQIILDTGGLPGLDEAFDLEKKLNYYTQCHDVGVYSAKRWNLLGLTTFSEVSKKFPEIFLRDWTVLFGWSYYEDWLKRISRAECEEVLKVVKDNLKQIDPEFKVELQGSYVRGALECGDIDLLFFKKGLDDTSEIGRVMERLALNLYDKGYVNCFLQLTTKIRQVFKHKITERISKCDLRIPSDDDYPPSAEVLKKFYLGFKLRSEFDPKYLQVKNKEYTRLEPTDQFMSLNSTDHPCRRVDFFCCRWSELGAARLQWTGPKEFNRWIRIQAAQKGMKLTQHGLYRGETTLLESFDEERIFELLGEEYVGPEERNSIIKKRQKT